MFAKWLDAAKIYADRRMPVMLAFGFSSGFPLLLVGSTLTVWLQESQIPYALIGLFSLTRMPYGFKWIWSPLIDRIRLPLFERLGRRRGWALFIQLCMLAAILAMSAVNPAEHTAWMALLALIVAGCSASQDIVLDAYRIDSFETAEQGAGSAVFVLGYRLGMLFSGAFALWLTTWLDWREVYIVMALGALVGIVTVLLAKEPYKDRAYREEREKLPFKPRLRRFLRESVYEPFKDFMHHHRWGLILLFILLYRLSDEYKAPMAFVFYKDMGFSNAEIAYVSKIYGMLATIAGGLLGGIYIKRSSLPKALMLFGVLQGVTNLVYIGQAYAGDNVYTLSLTICMDNLAAGMGTTALVAYMASLCNVAYSATQYALLSSLMSLPRDIFASTSGILADHVSWPLFFLIASLMVLPGLFLLAYMIKKKVLS